MVVVAFLGDAGVEALRFSTGDGQGPDAAGAVDEEVLSVAGPVGGFEEGAVAVDEAAFAGGDDEGFEGGFADAFFVGEGDAIGEDDVGEEGGLAVFRIVGGDAEADVDGIGEGRERAPTGWKGPPSLATETVKTSASRSSFTVAGARMGVRIP